MHGNSNRIEIEGASMRQLIKYGGVALAGLATSILTAVAVAVFDRITGFNLFTFAVWAIVPAGAGLCGFAAASGYYFAAKFLHQRPTKILLFQMIAIAAFTQMLIYWLEYVTLTIDGRHIADVIPFGQYLDIILTTAHYKMGRAMQADVGEVGSFGYWLAIFQFVGFLVGGAFVYLHLKTQSACPDCGKYLRSVAKKGDSFSDIDDFARYYDNVYAHPVDSPEFAEHVGAEYAAGAATKGTINLTTAVLECPQCFGQSVQESVQIYNGRDWSDVGDLGRWVAMPKGIDVRPVIGGRQLR